MNLKSAPPGGEQVLNPKYQPGHAERGEISNLDSEMRASRELVTANSTWIEPLRQEMGRVIIGQKHLLDRLLIALLTNGHVLLEGVPGLAKTLALKTLARLHFRAFQASAIYARHAARRHRRNHDLQPSGRRVSHQARPDIQQSDSGRRDQSRACQGSKRAPGGHAGAPGHHRRGNLPIACAISGSRDAEPPGAGGHISATGGADRPIHDEGGRRLSHANRGARDSRYDGDHRADGRAEYGGERLTSRRCSPCGQHAVRRRQGPRLHRRHRACDTAAHRCSA